MLQEQQSQFIPISLQLGLLYVVINHSGNGNSRRSVGSFPTTVFDFQSDRHPALDVLWIPRSFDSQFDATQAFCPAQHLANFSAEVARQLCLKSFEVRRRRTASTNCYLAHFESQANIGYAPGSRSGRQKLVADSVAATQFAQAKKWTAQFRQTDEQLIVGGMFGGKLPCNQ